MLTDNSAHVLEGLGDQLARRLLAAAALLASRQAGLAFEPATPQAVAQAGFVVRVGYRPTSSRGSRPFRGPGRDARRQREGLPDTLRRLRPQLQALIGRTA